MAAPPTSPDRRLDLDWLRIGAFALLIFYHIGMFYVTWDWHVKSSRASHAIEPLMMLVNPWRLVLLFIISGAATRFMADKVSAGQLAGSRMGRLLPPLLLAVLVIVPPQAYYEVVDAMRLGQLPVSVDWLENFYFKYVTASGHWCDFEGCLITPTWNHMWFVAYLAVYTLVLIALLPLLRRAPAALGRVLDGPGFIVAPWLYLWACRALLSPIFEGTHALVDDWYLHAVYFAAFLFGFAIAKHERFFEACRAWRLPALVATILCWVFEVGLDVPASLRVLDRGVHELQAWTAIVAAFGYARHYLSAADGPIRRYFTNAIFPFYIVHQTAIVVAAYHLDRLRLPLAIEVALLIALTLLACWATFEIARRTPLLRPWFGLSSNPRPRVLVGNGAGGHLG
jgi:glucans biosynthesis protein C